MKVTSLPRSTHMIWMMTWTVTVTVTVTDTEEAPLLLDDFSHNIYGKEHWCNGVDKTELVYWWLLIYCLTGCWMMNIKCGFLMNDVSFVVSHAHELPGISPNQKNPYNLFMNFEKKTMNPIVDHLTHRFRLIMGPPHIIYENCYGIWLAISSNYGLCSLISLNSLSDVCLDMARLWVDFWITKPGIR